MIEHGRMPGQETLGYVPSGLGGFTLKLVGSVGNESVLTPQPNVVERHDFGLDGLDIGSPTSQDSGDYPLSDMPDPIGHISSVAKYIASQYIQTPDRKSPSGQPEYLDTSLQPTSRQSLGRHRRGRHAKDAQEQAPAEVHSASVPDVSEDPSQFNGTNKQALAYPLQTPDTSIVASGNSLDLEVAPMQAPDYGTFSPTTSELVLAGARIWEQCQGGVEDSYGLGEWFGDMVANSESTTLPEFNKRLEEAYHDAPHLSDEALLFAREKFRAFRDSLDPSNPNTPAEQRLIADILLDLLPEPLPPRPRANHRRTKGAHRRGPGSSASNLSAKYSAVVEY